MNSKQFMDKQIMGMPGSPKDDFYYLFNYPQEDQSKSAVGSGLKTELKEETLPSYDFQPIRPVNSSSRSINLEETNNVGGGRAWDSVDAKGDLSNLRTYGSLDAVESANKEKDQNAYSAITVSEIDRTMKKHADNLLHALEGLSARLSQLETRTRHLEISVDGLKVDLGNDNGKTDGKLRQLENILREVQTGVQVLRDKQEIAEAQIQLSKLQVSKGDQQSESQKSTTQVDTVQQPVVQQPHQPLPAPMALNQPSQQQPPALPPSNAFPPPTHQNPPPVQLSTQLPTNQIPSVPQQEPYFTSGPLPEAAHQQYQLPPAQQPHLPPPPAPQQPFQSAPQLPQYSQPPQPPQQNQPVSPVNPSQLQPSLSRHYPEENPQLPPHSYPPSVRQPPSMTLPHSGPLPSQQFYGAAPHMYEPPSSRPSSGFSSGYVPPAGSNFNDSNYTGSPHHGSSSMKPHHFSSSTPSSGGSSYPRLPTAQLLPHALPTASSESGPSSGGTGNRVPIDDVVDKVAMMGFSRDQVRATVRKLTENGQSVDLNVVLDKLMNDGDGQPQKGWFGR